MTNQQDPQPIHQMKSKEHLKDLLVLRGLAETPESAERIILAARVRVGGEPALHAGMLVATDAVIEVGEPNRYVSRGGLKLEGALQDFTFNPEGLHCIDAGASTGGFTDCLLQAGAASVTAIDVNRGQFDWKLRINNQVTLFERTNIAKVEPVKTGAPFDLLVADLSFTSLARLAPKLAPFVCEEGSAIALVKPQFELPRDVVKDGVIRSSELHIQALQMVQDSFEKADLQVRAMSFSHILGPKGNIEFFIWAIKGGVTATIDAEQVVRLAHENLRGVAQ